MQLGEKQVLQSFEYTQAGRDKNCQPRETFPIAAAAGTNSGLGPIEGRNGRSQRLVRFHNTYSVALPD
jgi:hypothetical protein